ncbi:MAG: MMPL family transporter [archaeon]|jgi:hydrophobe/amphiphile efflux-3 (HAE3) family protein|nr:MMPL family transporter [archaeon]MDD2477643.1 MMPL family transporter [Candidatus ainarchaeum sp.]MDD3085050.1 MMPL family transporter [Candidatus ainarchaeum sp.]MDD4220824.1 MMPL family transporter [Candidatus ainarchaeum sp.]MDD4662324.1 MMPL family transporter [Candidatus ainarchaeum sp.]
MSFIENLLTRLAVIQSKYKYIILIITVLLSIFFIFGLTNIQMETDFSKMSPSDLEIFKLNDKITSNFGGNDIVVVLFRFDKTSDYKSEYNDIRNPEIINYLKTLETEYRKEASVDTVFSAATYLGSFNLNSVDEVKSAIDMMPALNQFFSKDYTTTVLYLTADLSGNQDKTIALTNMISDKLENIQKPSGIEYMVTGSAPVGVTVLDILGRDAIKTLILAAIIILLLLFITEFSIIKGIVVFSPIFLGVIWTIGTMGWLNLKLSVATVGIGAMILGLGVEYGVFLNTRYKEERDKGKTQLEALKIAVPAIGSAILGSGLTTIVGFLALTLSVMPMLQDLGKSLAIGIGFSLFISIFIAPAIIIIFEDLGIIFARKMHSLYGNITIKNGRLKK